MKDTNTPIKKIFEETAEKYISANKLSVPFIPFPDITHRPYWEGLDASLCKELVQAGEAALFSDIPALYASHYMTFTESGSRVDFETPYFARRHMLNALVIAECIENKGRFLKKIIDLIWAICEESTWVLPAHNSYKRNEPQIILPDTDRPVMELFSCETGEMLAMVLLSISTSLDAVSPVITKRIRSELKKRIITPYLNEHFWWMGNGDEPMCNWTPWCTQNVLIVAFSLPELSSEEEKLTIFTKASLSCDLFLKDYGEDGCCDEGAHYYRHAGLCLYGCMEILNAVSNNAFSFLYKDEKIKNIAAYISNIHVAGPYYFNFADCSTKAGRTGIREFLFGEATGQKFLCDLAASDCIASLDENTLMDDESQKLNLYYAFQTLYTLSEVREYAHLHKSEVAVPKDIYYESVGIWVARNKTFSLAVKAGDNDDSHNHNDVGSLILFKNSDPILVDIGVETYTKKTFSPDRYEIWTMQSCYHNVPTIDKANQHNGEKYRAEVLSMSLEATEKSISMDISKAYEKTVPTYIRTVSMNEFVTVTDTSDADAVLNFITYHEPKIIENCSNAISIEVGSALLSFEGCESPQIEVLPITDERLKTAWDHDLYRIRLKKTLKEVKLTIK